MPRNEELYGSLRELYSAALNSLDRYRRQPQRIPRYDVAVIRSMGGGGGSWGTETTENWPRLAREALIAVRPSAEYDAAATALANDPVIQPLLNKFVHVGWSHFELSADLCLEEFLVGCLIRQKSLAYSEESPQGTYREFDEFFHLPTVPYRAIVPIHGFSMVVPEITLSPRLRILELSLPQREVLLTYGLHRLGGPQVLTGFEQCAIEIRWEEPRGVADGHEAQRDMWVPREQVDSEVAELVRALRLFKRGAMGFSGKCVEPLRWIPVRNSTMLHGPILSTPIGRGYALESEEAARFPQFWVDYRRWVYKPGQRLRTALARLNSTYERSRPEDRIVDLVIGLESLLQPEGSRSELSYRVAVRGAYLLGRDALERTNVFDTLRTAYQIRSGLVHGDDPAEVISSKSGRSDVDAYVEGLEDLLRTTIKRFIEHRGDRSEADASLEIDGWILRGGPDGHSSGPRV